MENITGSTNISAGSSQVVGADFSVNGNDVIEARDVVLTGISENGNSSDNVHGFSSDHQLVDGSGISLFQVCNKCFCLGWCQGNLRLIISTILESIKASILLDGYPWFSLPVCRNLFDLHLVMSILLPLCMHRWIEFLVTWPT